MTDELYSQRQRRQREFAPRDFACLIWRDLAALGEQDYFAEALAEHVGATGQIEPPRMPDAPNIFLRRLREADVYDDFRRLASGQTSGGPPVSWHIGERADDVLWDTLEFAHSLLVSKPYREVVVADGVQQTIRATYSREDGRAIFRSTINPDLALHDPPMEMLDNGQVVQQAPGPLQPLLDAPVPDDVPAPLRDPLRDAIEQYRLRGATEHDKRSALKHLADVLEPLRAEIDEFILPADESALFHLANKFWIRHNDRNQQRNYDATVWLDWMFFVYVATARALLAVLDRQTLSESVYGPPPDDNGGLPL